MSNENFNNSNPEFEEANNTSSGKNFSRSNSDFIFSGLCGGLGEFQSIDPVWIRTILFFGIYLFPWLVVVYFVASFLLPKSKLNLSGEELDKKKNSNQKYLLGLIFLLLSANYFFESNYLKSSRNLFYVSNELIFSLFFIYAGFYNLFFVAKYSLEKSSKNIFTRSLSNKILLGVCSGFSNYLNVDVLVVRMVFALLGFMTFGLVGLIYFYIAMKTRGDNEIVL